MKQAPLSSYLLAGFPSFLVDSTEEQRVIDWISSAADEAAGNTNAPLDYEILLWRCTTGLCAPGGADSARSETRDITKALSVINDTTEDTPTIYIMLGLRKFLDDQKATPMLTQLFKDTILRLRTLGSHIFFVGPGISVPPEIEHEISMMDFKLPSKEELVILFTKMAEGIDSISVTKQLIERAAEAAVGMTEIEAENAAALSYTVYKTLNINLIHNEKKNAVKKSDVLEFIDVHESMDDVGDFDLLKGWVQKRSKMFTKDAIAYGLPYPKGILLTGVPGTGKSLLSHAIASYMQLPLIKFNVGAIFKKYVGDSEASVRSALNLIETVAPVIVWFDEIDKSFAGLSGGNGDSGVTKRVFQHILTWMQETKAMVFKIATANDITNLPPELYRAGRFDSIFASDLPQLGGRKEIFEIHIRKRGRDPRKFDMVKIGVASDGFVGAEIEHVIEEAMFTAFADGGREFTTDDILGEIKQVRPQSVYDREKIKAVRKFCKEKARPVSSESAISRNAAPKRKARRKVAIMN